MAIPRIITTAAKLALQYGPAVVAWVKSNPDAAKKASEAVQRVALKRQASASDILSTLAGLRDQVEYLRDSADDERERQRAEGFALELDRLDRAASLLGDDSPKDAVKRLAEKVRAVRDRVLEAFLAEQAEDAAQLQRGRGDAAKD